MWLYPVSIGIGSGQGGRDCYRELRRIPLLLLLLSTPVNKPVHTFAAHSSQLVATKIIRLGDALAAYGCYRFRARERKDKIVGTIAELRKGTLWLPILRTL
jgi:hypothetical protein